MKKIICFVIMILLLTVQLIPVYATSFPSDMQLSEDVYSEAEYLEAKNACEVFAEEAGDGTDRQIRTGYKLYAMDAGVFSNLITSDISLKQLVMDEWAGYERQYEWILPFGSVNYYSLRRVKDHWEVSSRTDNRYSNPASYQYNGAVWTVGIVDFYDVDYAMQQVEQNGEKLTGEQLVFILGAVNVTFFAFRSNKETYLVAFPWRQDLVGLENGVCYTAREVKEILDERYPVMYQGDEVEAEELLGSRPVSSYTRSDFDNVTTWPPEEKKPKTWLWVSGAIILVVGYAAVVYMVRRRQRQDIKV